MIRKSARALRVLLLLAATTPVIAQTPAPQSGTQTPAQTPAPTPQPGAQKAAPQSGAPATAAAAPAGSLSITPKNGQTEQQQWSDRYECYRLAKTQTGFDPAQQSPATATTAAAEQYRSAMVNCLQGRGYDAQYGALASAAAAAPVALAAPAAAAAATTPAAPASTFRHFAAHIDGGYTVTQGTSSKYLDNGANVGFGFIWFPTESLPLGLRVDGSWSRLDARNALLNLNGAAWTTGYQDIYGGDADVQLDLAHGYTSRSKFYLLGGVGWYRERTYLRQDSLESGIICYPYFCAPGVFSVTTAEQTTTSAWLRSWNAGLGWEISGGTGAASFFVEARYQRIQPYSTKNAFIPIRAGIRF